MEASPHNRGISPPVRGGTLRIFLIALILWSAVGGLQSESLSQPVDGEAKPVDGAVESSAKSDAVQDPPGGEAKEAGTKTDAETTPRRLTLSEAEEIALKNASTVRIQEKDSAIAELDRKIARSSYFPELAAVGGYTYTDPPAGVKKQILPGIPLNLTFGALANYSYGVQMRYILFSGGRRGDAYRAAKMGKEASQWLMKDAVRGSLHDARTTFVGVLLLRKMRDLSLEGRDRAADRLRDAENRFRAGTISKLELLRARSDASDAELVASESEDRYRAGLDRLKIVLDLPLGEKVDAAGDLTSSTELLENLSVEKLHGASPEFAQLEATRIRTRQAHINVDAKKGAFWPTLSAGVQYNRINPYLGQKKYGDAVAASVMATFPLFEGGRLRNDYEKAKLQADKAEIAESEMQKQLLAYRTLLLDRIDTDRKNLGARKENIERARLARDATKVAQENGASTLKDLADSELILFRAEVEYSRAVADMLEALADLERLDGNSSGIFQALDKSEVGGDANKK